MHLDAAADSLWTKAAIIGMVLSQLILSLDIIFLTENPFAKHANGVTFKMNEKHMTL